MTLTLLYVAMQRCVKFIENKAPERCCKGEVKLKARETNPQNKTFTIAQLYGTLNFRKGGHLSGLRQQRKGA